MLEQISSFSLRRPITASACPRFGQLQRIVPYGLPVRTLTTKTQLSTAHHSTSHHITSLVTTDCYQHHDTAPSSRHRSHSPSQQPCRPFCRPLRWALAIWSDIWTSLKSTSDASATSTDRLMKQKIRIEWTSTASARENCDLHASRPRLA